ncbi:SMP-30/gluconolactonase/LRE family protein [Chryseobacterium sp. PMSZPI]|nr:T9SS type A sorting domain-containing protein [Chryseobacterium sp. PMSZPI]
MKAIFTQLMIGLTVLLNYPLQAQTVTTFAGSTQGYADGLGTAAQFNLPQGLCNDASGNLYVVDYVNNRIRKITPQGQVTTLAGSTKGYADGLGTAAKFYYPRHITIDPSGNLYVADESNHRIRKITPQGQVTTLAGSTKGYADGVGTAAQFNNPNGLAIDPSGNLYVADTYNHRIRKITPEGQVTTLAGSTQDYADGIGIAAKFNKPFGMCIDTLGNLFVIDGANYLIRKITPQGQVTTLAGSTKGYADGLGTTAKFDSTTGLAIDTSGNLYLADDNNNRIRKITPQGQVSTLTGSTQGYADGQGTAAQFFSPSGVSVDNLGNIYVTDTYNNRIRKITIQTLGISETNKTSKVKIYPNPAGDFVTIDASPFKNASARLYDTSGKLIKSPPLKNGKNTLN